MMNAVYRYILCVICAVMLCGTVRILFPVNDGSLMKLVTGFVITVVVLSPLVNKEKISLQTHFENLLTDSEFAVEEGRLAARQMSTEFIKEKTESYVLSKALELGADVSVDVVLSDTDLPVPTQITICGLVSPYTKMKLSECICNDLGIVEDEQVWIS